MASERSTFVNALIGAVVSIVLAFLPLSPLLGGAVAGYLERRDGLRVGALSGLIAALPLALVVTLGAAVFVIVPAPGPGAGLGVGFFVLFLVVLLVAGLYTVTLGAVGGYLGVYVEREL